MAKARPPKKSGGDPGAKQRPSGATAAPRPTLSFSRVNAVWLGTGAAAIALGFALLAAGSTTIAPILLVLGYLVLLPIGIIKK